MCLFEIHNNLIWYFVKRRRIAPVKKCRLSLCMTDRCLLTSIFKIYIKFPFSWYIICLVPKVSNNFNLSHGQYSSSFLWPNVSNFDSIYFTFIVILLTVTMTHWRNFKEKSRRNFKETPGNNIPRERICFNERDTNKLVTAKRTEKVWGKRKRREDTIISSTVVNEEYLRRRSIQKKKMVVPPTKFAMLRGKNWRKMRRLGSTRYSLWIYLPKKLWEERYLHKLWFFVVFASDCKC